MGMLTKAAAMRGSIAAMKMLIVLVPGQWLALGVQPARG